MSAERRARQIRIARRIGDLAAAAILEGGRVYRPESDRYPILCGLRWASLVRLPESELRVMDGNR